MNKKSLSGKVFILIKCKNPQTRKEFVVKKRYVIISIVLAVSLYCLMPSHATINTELQPYIDSVDQVQKGMTLWQLIKTGGFIMVVLGGMSIAAIASIIFNFMTLQKTKLAPDDFTEDIMQKLSGKKHKIAEELCRSQNNIISKIVLAGLSKKIKGAVVAREAAETCARKEVANLWQNISYLSDIAMVSPMIGLLGTVLGMIQAFNVIAFQTAVVKPMLLAGGVSKAMVTTAGGLIVAIPAMIFYSYFRGKVQEISNVVESHSSDILKMMEEV